MENIRQSKQEAFTETLERAYLVGADTGEGEAFVRSMEELGNLAQACNMEVVGYMTQKLNAVNHGLYIGTGKVKEVKEKAEELNADIILFDNALSPVQLRNLQRELDMPVLDRTALILEIFSSRAKTREAKLQVEVARLQYMLPRLVGMHAALSRQGGGSSGGSSGGGTLSNRGSGEKKIELDRRTIEQTLTSLKRELEVVSHEKETQRKLRMASGIPRVALVGYTNAGKSTLMNRMVDEYMKSDEKMVLEKDMLFATLETTVRKIIPEKNKEFLLSDTVGFISKLPHGLVKAFRSTLDEVKEADLLLLVVDYSDSHYKEQLKVTQETLKELGADEIPNIIIYNKADLFHENQVNQSNQQNQANQSNQQNQVNQSNPENQQNQSSQLNLADVQSGDDRMQLMKFPMIDGNSIYMAAKPKIGLKELVGMINDKVFSDYVNCTMRVPFDKGQIIGYLNQNAQVISTKYLEDGTEVELKCTNADYNRYLQYVIN